MSSRRIKKIDSDFIGKTVVDQIGRQGYSFTTNRYMRKSPKGFWWIIFPCRFTVTPFPEIPTKQPYELMTSSLPSPSRFRYSFFRCSIIFCSALLHAVPYPDLYEGHKSPHNPEAFFFYTFPHPESMHEVVQPANGD